MKTLLHITFAKIRRGAKKSIFQSVAALVSMFVISFFVCFTSSLETFKNANPTFGIEATDGESVLTIESLREFFNDIISGISLISCVIIVLSLVSLFIYTRLRTEENRHFSMALASIGATSVQRRVISITETLLLYGVPVIVGSFLGLLPSSLFTNMVAGIFTRDYSAPMSSLLIPLCLSIVGILAVLVFTYTSGIRRKKPIIEMVRSHNEKEAGETHNYRKSYIFRQMPPEQRIAKKSVDYYKSTYRRITFMFICCVLYPILAILFFAIVSGSSVADYTPGYGIDIVGLVDVFAKNIAIFGALAFLLLTVFGVLQTVYIIQAHNRVRRETLTLYKSMGMTDSSIKKVLKYEYSTAAFHAVIYLIFIMVLIFFGIKNF